MHWQLIIEKRAYFRDFWFLKVWGDVNNPDSPSAPSYITADCGNVLTAFTQCLELENIFTYCKAITTNLVPLTSRYTSNDFISLTTINLSVRPTKKKKMETWWWEVCRLPGTSGTFLFYVTFWTRQHSFSGDLSLYERYVFFFFCWFCSFPFFFFLVCNNKNLCKGYYLHFTKAMINWRSLTLCLMVIWKEKLQ